MKCVLNQSVPNFDYCENGKPSITVINLLRVLFRNKSSNLLYTFKSRYLSYFPDVLRSEADLHKIIRTLKTLKLSAENQECLVQFEKSTYTMMCNIFKQMYKTTSLLQDDTAMVNLVSLMQDVFPDVKYNTLTRRLQRVKLFAYGDNDENYDFICCYEIDNFLDMLATYCRSRYKKAVDKYREKCNHIPCIKV